MPSVVSRLAPLLLLLVATPASATRNRVTALVDITWTPDAAHHPVGVGLALEGARALTQPLPTRPSPPFDGTLGLGVRLRLYGDGDVDFGVEPILGVVGGAPDLACGSGTLAQAALDVRPGLVLRTRGGPGLSLGGAATGIYRVVPVRVHASAVLPFRRAPRLLPRADGRLQDATLAVGTGLSRHMRSCFFRGSVHPDAGPPEAPD